MGYATHDHEWLPCGMGQHGEPFMYEDFSLFVYFECDYVEVTGRQYSAAHDEYFEETGAECDARLYHRFDCTKVERLDGLRQAAHDDHDMRTLAAGADALSEMYNAYPSLGYELSLAAEQRLTEGLDDDPHPLAVEFTDRQARPTSEYTFTVGPGDVEYRLTFEHKEEVVDP